MATSINFSGLGSGIDFSQIADAIIAERMQPVTQMQSKATSYASHSDALKQLNAALANLTNAAQALNSADLGTGRTASSSDSSVVSASATSAAAAGQISISVTRLASSLTQATHSFASATSAVLADPNTPATFELRKGGAATGQSFTIDASNNTLAGLRDAINAANAGVTATIVDVAGDGTQNQLVLTSTDTGAAGRVELVETTATGTGDALSLRSLNPPGATNDFSALDASLKVNGLDITRPTNTISDAVSGVTFNLKQTGDASVTVARATDISDKLQAFINAYNAVQDFINGQYKTDSRGHPTGTLAGDSTLRTVQQALRNAIGESSSTNGGALTSLTDIGVGRDENGHLTLDTTVLNQKLNSSFNDVRSLLAGSDATHAGFAADFYSVSNGLSDNISGVVQAAIKGYQDSAQRLNDSAANQINALNLLRQSLTRQFAAADAAIAQLNNQGTALGNTLKSFQSGGSSSSSG